ncbi:muscarinic acetylcholine receptor M2-like [Clavelina lepadiformis]|uniref:G-protein coupled receptors family 1 profile domain-containing protein n=1 Tax=Clavelina lepadiformis TaxID=159417 RepID=A0ABP0GWE4_CLALP
MENSTEIPPVKVPLNLETTLWVCFFAVCFSLVTVIANVFVIVAFKMNPRLQTITNFFIISLACADTVIGLISMNLFTIFVVQGRWTLGEAVCDIWLCVDYVASNASVMNLLIICIDRYLALTQPMTYRIKRTKKRACLMIASAWLISIIVWVPVILFWPLMDGGRKVPEDDCYMQIIESSPAATISTAMIAFYVPVIVMSVLSRHICRVKEEHKKFTQKFRKVSTTSSVAKTSSWTQESKINEEDNQNASKLGTRRLSNLMHGREKDNVPVNRGISPNNFGTSNVEGPRLTESSSGCKFTRTESKSLLPVATSFTSRPTRRSFKRSIENIKRANSDNKAARMLLCIILAFVITWAPYNIVVVISTFCESCVPDVLWKISYWLCYMNSTINPACYALCDQEFRDTFRHLIRCQRLSTVHRSTRVGTSEMQ